MSTLNKAACSDVYSFDDGVYQFVYTPSTGKVSFRNHCCIKTLKHFILRGFDIDESNRRQTNLSKGIFKAVAPIEWSEEDVINNISKTVAELKNESESKRIKDQLVLEAQCVDMHTGKPLDLAAIHKRMRYLKAEKQIQMLLQLLNSYNIELLRPKNPIMFKSTNSLQTIYDMGFKYTKQLFEEGRLRKLSVDDYESKMSASFMHIS